MASWKRLLARFLPITDWLINYDTQWLGQDLTAALTLTTVVVPQALAYATLAEIPAIYGLYTSILPVIIYACFGTSRHLSVGTFSLTALLIASSVDSILLSSAYDGYTPTVSDTTSLRHSVPMSVRVGIVMMLTFMTGVFNLLMSFLRLGRFIENYLLPDALVSGLLTAAAFQVAASQIRPFLDVSAPSFNDSLGMFKTLVSIIKNLHTTNLISLTLGISTMVAIYGFKWLNGRLGLGVTLAKSSSTMVKYDGNSGDNQITPNEDIINDVDLSRGSSSKFCLPETTAESVITITSDTSLLSTPTDDSETQDQPIKSASDDGCSCKFRMPIPEMLIPVVIMSLITFCFDLHAQPTNVSIVGAIPAGFPAPINPFSQSSLCTQDMISHGNCNLAKIVLASIFPSITIGLATFILTAAIAKMYEKRLKYEKPVDFDQDMLAMGLMSLLGSVLGNAFVSSGSLSRSALVVNMGGRTQLVGVLASFAVMLAVLFASVLLYYIPFSVLAAVVLVAILKVTLQLKHGIDLIIIGWDLKRLHRQLSSTTTIAVHTTLLSDGICDRWKSKRYEAVVWWITFLMVILVDLGSGIAIGITVYAVMLFIDMALPKWVELGRAEALAGTDVLSRKQQKQPMTNEIKMSIEVDMTNPLLNKVSFYRSIKASGFLTLDNVEQWTDVARQCRDPQVYIDNLEARIQQISFPERVSTNILIYQYRSPQYLMYTQLLRWKVMLICRSKARSPSSIASTLRSDNNPGIGFATNLHLILDVSNWPLGEDEEHLSSNTAFIRALNDLSQMAHLKYGILLIFVHNTNGNAFDLVSPQHQHAVICKTVTEAVDHLFIRSDGHSIA